MTVRPPSPPCLLAGDLLDFPGPASPRLRRGLLAIGPDATIARVVETQDPSQPPPAELAAFGPPVPVGLILPGLIDLHTHWPQWPIIGSDGLQLLEWLRTIVFPAEAAFKDPAIAYQTTRSMAGALLASGTTTAVAFSSSHPGPAFDAVVDALRDAGLRCHCGPALMDQHCPPELAVAAAEVLPRLAALADELPARTAGRVELAVSPRFSLCCSADLMQQAARLAAARKLVVQTHLAENLDECAEVARRFPAAASYTDVYDRAGMLGPRTLLAHGIHLSPAELEQIAQAGASIVHCPLANSFLRSGQFAWSRTESAGVGVGLGTDIGAGYRPGLPAVGAAAIATAKQRSLAHPDEPGSIPTPARVWHAMTAGAAACIGAGQRLGLLEPGCTADLVLIEPGASWPLPPATLDLLVSRLLYGWDLLSRRTMVAGRLVGSFAPQSA